MEGKGKDIFGYLIYCSNVYIITTFMSFLDSNELQEIVDAALKANRSETFFRVAVAKHFVSSYLNRVDRSIFFLFYEETEFQAIERQSINTMAINNY